MKSFFWIPIEPRILEGSIWKKVTKSHNFLQIDDTKIQLNTKKIEEEFCQKKTETIKPQVKIEKQIKQSFLKPDKSRMINIVLNKIRIQPIDIIDALEIYKLEIFRQEVCELLIPILPTETEITDIQNSNCENENLEISNQFVLMFADIIGYKERIKTIYFKLLYTEDVDTINKEINRFIKIFKYLQSGDTLKKWLEILLTFGNYLNGGTNRGSAFGFKLDILNKLVDLKTKDNKRSFLYYIIKYISDNMSNQNLFDLLPKLNKFHKLHYQCIVESFKELNCRFNEVTKLKKLSEAKATELSSDDKTIDFLDSFYFDAEKRIKELDKKINQIDFEYLKIIQLFGEDIKTLTLDVFVNIIKSFSKQLNEAMIIFKDDKEKQEKKEKLEKLRSKG